MKAIPEISDIHFESEVLKSSHPVAVDFRAPWCGPCKMLAPVLKEIAAEQSGRARIVKVNVDNHPAAAER